MDIYIRLTVEFVDGALHPPPLGGHGRQVVASEILEVVFFWGGEDGCFG